MSWHSDMTLKTNEVGASGKSHLDICVGPKMTAQGGHNNRKGPIETDVYPGGPRSRSKNIHSLGDRKCAAAAVAITFGVEPFGAGHCCREFCLQALLGPFQGLRCWLAIQLCANRLRRGQPGIRIPRGLAYGCFELSNVLAAGTGLGGCRA
jgi:hypothetical protein